MSAGDASRSPRHNAPAICTFYVARRSRAGAWRRGARRAAPTITTMRRAPSMLTPRQELILQKVVEGYLDAGQPVGSKVTRRREGRRAGGRARSATSSRSSRSAACSRIPTPPPAACPTDAGYRYFVDRLLGELRPDEGRALGVCSSCAARSTRRCASPPRSSRSSTSLLAIVSAPPIESATIRHVEVLVLQPQVLMVVIITSTGGVSKRIFTSDAPVDPGLADWAASYLNERLVGMGLGARMLHSRLADPSLSAERARLPGRDSRPRSPSSPSPATTSSTSTAPRGCWPSTAGSELGQLNALMGMLERRVSLLGVLRAALSARDVYIRIGEENEDPALRSLAVVAASYGLPQRSLGNGLGDRPGAHGLRDGDPLGARGRAVALALRRRRLRGD